MIFQNKFWGYEIDIPKNWIHKNFQDIDGFALDPKAFHPDYEGKRLGQLLIRGEWNSKNRTLEDLWGQHFTKLSIMLGAKQIGSAPWQMGGATGFEVEILLPKRDKKRLWVGILQHGRVILHFMVMHWKENRADFEPQATNTISSLHFTKNVSEITTNHFGLPIPPNYSPVNPVEFIEDIKNPDDWLAYQGDRSVGALQSFYTREVPNYEWEILAYTPFPGPSQLNFSRLQLQKNDATVTLGLMPAKDENLTSRIAMKYQEEKQ